MEQHSKSACNADMQDRAARFEYRDDMIDQALMDTFPASDPISFAGLD
jgi:hypothetical protein